MSTKSTPEKKPASAAAEPQDFELTLDEFCARMSSEDSRVELIGAFHVTETQAKRIKATMAQFQSRLDAFANKPA